MGTGWHDHLLTHAIRRVVSSLRLGGRGHATDAVGERTTLSSISVFPAGWSSLPVLRYGFGNVSGHIGRSGAEAHHVHGRFRHALHDARHAPLCERANTDGAAVQLGDV